MATARSEPLFQLHRRLIDVCRLLALLLALVLAPASLAAQEVPPTLSLRDALALARQHNPDLRRAAIEVDRVAVGERAGWGAFLPRLSSDVSLVDFSSRTMTARNEFGQPVALEDAAEFSATSAWGRLGASMTVFDGFRRVGELRAARAESRAASAFDDAEADRIEAEVQHRFYGALGAERMVEMEARLLASAEERLDGTRAMVRAGRATPQDVLGAEVDLARQQMALADAGADAYTARLALLEVLGVEGEPDFSVAGEFPELVDPAGLAADALVAAALASSPRIRRAEASAARARHLAGAARSERWPTVQLSAGMNREISVSDAAQVGSFPWNRGTFLGVSVSLPVFTGFSGSAQIANARAARANAQEELRSARLATEREVRTALTETAKAYGSVRLSERAVELSRRRRDVGQEGFRRGLISFTELQQLIEQAAQTERAAVRAQMQYARAVATLAQVTGRDMDPARPVQGPQ